MQKTGLTDFKDHTEKADFGPRHLANEEISIDPFLLKHKKTMRT